MIQKKREEYQENYGQGRPFEMNARYPIEKNDIERQKPVIIDLEDLNSERGMPKNFYRKAGRTLESFMGYFTKESPKDEPDIQ